MSSIYVGLISGTSMDAVDAALVTIENQHLSVIDFIEYPIVDTLRTQMKSLTANSSMQQIAELDVALGELFAETVTELLQRNQTPATAVTAIGSHGQTVFHMPDSDCPSSWQIADPNIIACRTGITTVADFRRKDLALGGQGAPLAPIYHAMQFASGACRWVLNIGGFANLTLLPAAAGQPIIGFDSGPGNALLDDWCRLKKNRAFDENGAWAASGKVIPNLLKDCLADDYFLARIPKSTGRDQFNLDWLREKLPNSYADQDVQATLLALTVETIALATEQYAVKAQDMVVCGGGAYNGFLMSGLQTRLANISVHSSEVFGVNPSAVEACCFAWLAHQRLNDQYGNLPSVTNARSSAVLGGVYSGR